MALLLLIDDDDDFRPMLTRTLEKLGHCVVQLRDGQEATALYARVHPDAVITDLVMPGQEGIETIFSLRAMNPNVRIIAMSGGGRVSANSYLRIANAIGAQRILAKPFSTDELLSALATVVGSPEAVITSQTHGGSESS